MTALNDERSIRAWYEAFNGDRMADFVGCFSSTATFRQVNGVRIYEGRDKIRGYISSLDVFIEDASIDKITVIAKPRLVSHRPSAVACYGVEYVLNGRYIRTLPGLEGRANAHGDVVCVPAHELVWVDAQGKVLWADQAIDLSALD